MVPQSPPEQVQIFYHGINGIHQENILTTFIIATRYRTKKLIDSITSVLRTCSNPNCVEFIVALDNDDTETLALITSIKLKARITFLVSERYGYNNLNVYYNLAAKYAKGRWIWLWTDDIEMTCENWDDILLRYDERLIVINPYTTNAPWNEYTKDVCIIPIVSRKWYEVLGRISAWNHIDTYVFRVAKSFYMIVQDYRLTNIHKKSDEHEVVAYHVVPFPFDEFKKDQVILFQALGMRSIILNYIKTFPYREYRKIIRTKDKIFSLIRKI